MRFVLSATAIAALFLASVRGAPTNGGSGGGTSTSTTTSGEATTTGCTVSSGNCAQDGSSNYHSLSLTYTSGTGKFSGTIKTNLCASYAYGYQNGSNAITSSQYHTASCISQTFPAPDYTSTPVAAPTLGRIGLSMKGVNIYGPMDAGFTDGQICTGGTCQAYTDLDVCYKKLQYECASTFSKGMWLDDCGGHANAYHYHANMYCDFNKSASGHSSLIGVIMDGRGIYGKYESTGTVPTDLDACNGHYGDVPAYNDSNGNYFPAATNVYHYHTTDKPPYTVGCFGPVASLTACKALYSGCNNGYYCITTGSGKIYYDDACPCFQQNGSTYNQDYTSTCSSSATHFKASMAVAFLFALTSLMLMI